MYHPPRGAREDQCYGCGNGEPLQRLPGRRSKSQDHVIPRHHERAAASAKARNTTAVLRGEAVSGIHREEPQLIKIALIECG